MGDEPFFVHLADDLIDAAQPCLTQMARVYEERQGSVLGVEEVEPGETDRYGIVAVRPVAPRLSQIERIVEKPKPAEAPSTLAVVGRYVLTPAIYQKLESTGRGAGGEIQLTDGIAALLQDEPVFAYAFEGTRYDCGSKLGYLEATVEFALRHPELGKPFAEYLSRVAARKLGLTRPEGDQSQKRDELSRAFVYGMRRCNAATHRSAVCPSQSAGRRPVGQRPARTSATLAGQLRGPDQPVRPFRDRDRPFRVLAQRQARNTEIGPFLLHAARVRDDGARDWTRLMNST